MPKKYITGFIEPLTYLINKTFSEDTFPTKLKLSRVMTILKADNPMFLTNYKPISILTFYNILNFLEENSIIFNHQFGFRQKHSTSHAISTLIHTITNSLDHGEIVIYIFLDLNKAIDTVNHRIL